MTIKEFFRKNAADFTAGDMEACADTLAVPTTIYVGRRHMHIGDRAQLLDMLREYRRNLRVESFDRTEVEVHHVTNDRKDRWQAFMTWQNLNDHGEIISKFDATYILCETMPGRLQCVTAEVIPPVNDRVLAGLPLV